VRAIRSGALLREGSRQFSAGLGVERDAVAGPGSGHDTFGIEASLEPPIAGAVRRHRPPDDRAVSPYTSKAAGGERDRGFGTIGDTVDARFLELPDPLLPP
jgi:hypothetical protein